MNSDALDRLLDRAGLITGVHGEILDPQEEFLDLAARFTDLPGTVVLLSGGDLDHARYHILGVLPWLTLSARPGTAVLRLDGRELEIENQPFDILRQVMRRLRLPAGRWSSPMASGLMGYLAYDLKDGLERLPRTSVDAVYLPHMLLYAPALLVVHDRREQTTRLLALRRRAEGVPGVREIVGRFHERLIAPAPKTVPFSAQSQRLTSNFTRETYQAAVKRVIDYITAGDVYQVNLSHRFQVPCHGDGFTLFRRLYEENPAPFYAFVQAGDHQVVSTSPERFIQRRGRRVEARPIKGTRPRGATPEKDRALRGELIQSPKDDAELSMIVDLLRNDMGKVCAPGSVSVAEHKRLEAYRNVYLLVSKIEGRLDQGNESVDLLQAVFPGGSITGCPKVRAMEIIDQLESVRRHVYCGSLGYLGFDDNLDLSIAIRTATLINGMLYFSVGGGIVYDSDPAAEYEETLHKGRTLLSACRGGQTVAHEPVVWHNGRLVPEHAAVVPATDLGLLYGFGFFETLRVDCGRPPLLGNHIARFDHTWRALMPGPPPDLTWREIIDQVVTANGLKSRCAAVKILATRGTRDAAPWDHTLLVTARPYAHRLKGIDAAGLRLGIYPQARQSPLAVHKTLNYLYYLQAGQWARKNQFDEAVILNPDNTVSETNTANLLLINGREVTRPQSPAVLPGVMAQAACRLLTVWGYKVLQNRVAQEALLTAEQVLAANALMGVVPVAGIDQRTRPAPGDLAELLNDELIPGWRI